VRYYFANDAALSAAKNGKPLPDGSVLFAEVYSTKNGADGQPLTGADGFFVPDQLLFYTAMAREAGWGKEIPDMLRNETGTTRHSRPASSFGRSTRQNASPATSRSTR
jgi:hypothetical protein